MAELWIVSLIWAFSFGIIKDSLSSLDASFVAAARLLLSAIVFLPFLRLRGVPIRLRWRLVLIGAVQFGLMYVSYISAFRYLQAYEVALFTIFTPIYVTLINDLIEKRFDLLNLATALLAVLGTGIVEGANLSQSGVLQGVLLVQISNLCFAYGQVLYRLLMQGASEVRDTRVFGLLYAGGFAAAGLAAIAFTNWSRVIPNGNQALALVYLGVVASGLGFYLWNRGARKVRAGALAVFNDLKVPLAVAVSLLFFGEKADLVRLLVGGGIVLAALAINEYAAPGLRKAITREQPHGTSF